MDGLITGHCIVDLEPEGGNSGGRIIAEGTPEETIKVKNSNAGKHLKDTIKVKK